jgi:hypothetical protein
LLTTLVASQERVLTNVAAIGCHSHGHVEIVVGFDADNVIEIDRLSFSQQGCLFHRCLMLVGQAISNGSGKDLS